MNRSSSRKVSFKGDGSGEKSSDYRRGASPAFAVNRNSSQERLRTSETRIGATPDKRSPAPLPRSSNAEDGVPSQRILFSIVDKLDEVLAKMNTLSKSGGNGSMDEVLRLLVAMTERQKQMELDIASLRAAVAGGTIGAQTTLGRVTELKPSESRVQQSLLSETRETRATPEQSSTLRRDEEARRSVGRAIQTSNVFEDKDYSRYIEEKNRRVQGASPARDTLTRSPNVEATQSTEKRRFEEQRSLRSEGLDRSVTPSRIEDRRRQIAEEIERQIADAREQTQRARLNEVQGRSSVDRRSREDRP
eukprot:TRINITY_DN3209_c0_g2_i2.p1 TRINITY_DN3209_c0_g2~~TRINITY_DN3209_c0_g2_i2.p1  ORF type:complete len:305 (-),score=61.04 TRINITY_DN3209_c0_g2_i2:47-961(-)